MPIGKTPPPAVHCAPRFAAAGIVAMCMSLTLASSTALAAANDPTQSIQRDSESARAMKMEEPSYQTREERLKAKPLDWKATIGKPKPRKLSPAETKALRLAKPQTSEGGAPDPKADAEARRLHPNDWK